DHRVVAGGPVAAEPEAVRELVLLDGSGCDLHTAVLRQGAVSDGHRLSDLPRAVSDRRSGLAARAAPADGTGMSTFQHGLVIGKFYPPHAGHHFLIRSAAESCARVTVVVMAADVESIPLAARVDWIRRAHGERSGVAVVGVRDNLAVDYESESAWLGHVALMREAIAGGPHGLAGVEVDAVFTSEAYGAELARRFDAADVRLDALRATHAVSGTKVRADPVAAWDALEPPVRGWFAKRVVVVGAESSGTTTLSLDLAHALRKRRGP